MAPILANNNASGAYLRKSKLAAAFLSSSMTLCEPTPIATPVIWAAWAKRWFTFSTNASSPPVMEEISKGKLKRLPISSMLGSTSAKLISGMARCCNAIASKNRPLRSTPSSLPITSMCCRFRRFV